MAEALQETRKGGTLVKAVPEREETIAVRTGAVPKAPRKSISIG
jgi:hypothetical protein